MFLCFCERYKFIGRGEEEERRREKGRERRGERKGRKF